MGEKTKIEWCDHTFNPWRGCTKVAAGCANCYADRQARRSPGTLGIWGDDGTRVLASESMWREPLRWNNWARIAIETWNLSAEDVGGEHNLLAQGFIKPERPRVFCASLADVFEDWPGQVSVKISGKSHFSKGMSEPITLNDVRLRLFGLIDATPHLDWLLLTKRPENIRRMWPTPSDSPCRDGLGSVSHDFMGSRCLKCNHPKQRDNVWLGTSIATQEDADKNIPELLKCRDLSPALFVSAEPLIGPVDMRRVPGINKIGNGPGIDWLIVGGESGPKARPMHPAWARSLRDQCQAAGVPYFFKQWGEWLSHSQAQYCGAHYSVPRHKFDDDNLASRVGKNLAGRLLDGREWNEFPRVEGGDE